MLPYTITILQENEKFKFLKFKYVDPEIRK